MKINRFEDLEVWKKSRELVNLAYGLTDKDLFRKDFGLKEQLQRAAVSCMSNIAEGFDSGSNQYFLQYLLYTRRSSSEVQSISYVALDRQYITYKEFEDLYAKSKLVGKLTNGFIAYLKTNKNRQTGKPANRLTNKGFTLIELMLVVIIIGVLAAMVMPRLVGRSEQARIAAAKADINSNIATALDMYELDIGHYPQDLKNLRNENGVEGYKGPYLKKDPKDPWGRDYDYKVESDGKDYTLCSKGPDEAKPDDDICNK